jgi:hypothetical protein
VQSSFFDSFESNQKTHFFAEGGHLGGMDKRSEGVFCLFDFGVDLDIKSLNLSFFISHENVSRFVSSAGKINDVLITVF